MVLHNPHLRHYLVVSCLGHIGHGRPIRIALPRVLCLFTQLEQPVRRSGIKGPHQAPVLLTQCGTQRTQ